MMWLRIFVLLFICSPLSVFAQQAIIRSGEHGGFTRLVVPIPRDGEWQVTQQERTLKLTVPGFAGRFETSDIFQLIQRTRILSVGADSNTLTIEMGCDCKVAPFVVRDRFVVLDIAEQATALNAPVISPQAVKQQENLLPRLADIGTEMKAEPPKISLPIAPQRMGQSLSAHLKPNDLPTRVREPLSEKEQSALVEMQERLLQELSAAATRGILNPQPGARASDDPLGGAVPKDTQVANDPTMPPKVTPGTTNNIRVTSSNDMSTLSRHQNMPVSSTGVSCPPNDSYDIARWADSRPFHQQMGSIRRGLYGEFDRLEPETAKTLAKLYVHFGFGAEAIQILALDNDVKQASPYLADIAYIMETGTTPEGSTLNQFIECDTDISLWGILAKATLEAGHTIDPDAALRALNKLPVHLRKFLAPELSQRFLSHGDTSAAAAAMRTIERLPSSLPTAGKMAQADIAIDEGDLAKGVEVLSDVITDNTSQSPKALVTLVQTQLKAGQPISAETASLIEAYAKELKGSDIGPELLNAHVLALVRSGQFDGAFAAMDELGDALDENTALNLRLSVLKEVTAAAEDIIFLEYVFAQGDQDLALLANRQKMDLATRLFELGFPERAETVLLTLQERPLIAERQILMAEIAISQKQPVRALAALGDMNGATTDALRAEAQLMLGAFGEAASLFRQAEQAEEAVRAAWLGERWDRENLDGDSAFGPILALTETIVEVPETSAGMLGKSDSVLQESEQARETLTNFLATPQVSVESSTPPQ